MSKLNKPKFMAECAANPDFAAFCKKEGLFNRGKAFEKVKSEAKPKK